MSEDINESDLPDQIPEIDDREPLESNDDFSTIRGRILRQIPLGVRSPELEQDILSIPDGDTDNKYRYIYQYASCVIKGRWLEAEKFISKPDQYYNSNYAYWYAQDIIHGPWVGTYKEQAEDTILNHSEFDKEYNDLCKGTYQPLSF